MWIVHSPLSHSCGNVKQLFIYTFNFCHFYSHNPSSNAQTQGKLVKEVVIMSLMILLMTIRRIQKVSVFALSRTVLSLSLFFCQYYNNRNCYFRRLQFSLQLYFLLPSILEFDFSPCSVDSFRFWLWSRGFHLRYRLPFFPLIFLHSVWFWFDSLENYLCTPVCRGYHIITITNNYTTTHRRHRRCQRSESRRWAAPQYT